MYLEKLDFSNISIGNHREPEKLSLLDKKHCLKTKSRQNIGILRVIKVGKIYQYRKFSD